MSYLNVILFVVFFSPFSIAVTSLGEERGNLSAFRTFVRFALVWICRFPLPLGVWEGLRFVIVALPGLFSYLFNSDEQCQNSKMLIYYDIFLTYWYTVNSYIHFLRLDKSIDMSQNY